ncbi:N-6 DNA methylase [Alkalicella caledoniensis]|uniref:site-specific DNA-methyltransferase (adenine-specific) n=1 Tax=Alkalicella caledoniensis TaxID=2731377 RepID=A0A7G9WB53_ALKCA|nr:N-6 DNA methylase [Alkalicella caledoniensis]QNO15915.1 N-6 DNA methylase [Alkalicella caledoniensis]
MDKKMYENLKHKNYNEAVNDFTTILREKLSTEDSMPIVVAASTLALVMKERETESETISYVEKFIDDETTLSFLRKVQKDYGNRIKDYSKKYDSDTLRAAALFSETKRFSEGDISSTPEGISNLAISLLSLTKDDVMLDLGSGVASFSIQAAVKSNCDMLYGVEINTNNVIIANLRRFITGLPIKIIQGNIVSQDYSDLSANKVFSNFPLGMRFSALEKYIVKNSKLKKYFKEAKRTVSGDWVFGMASYLNTKMPGKAVALMSNAGTWNKPDEQFRKNLVEGGFVEGVILLPPRLLSSTGIPLTMIVLSENNKEIKMVDATEIFTAGRRQNSLEPNDVETIINAYHNNTKISKRLKNNEVAQQEFILNPQRYIGTDSGLVDGIPLGDLTKAINRGAMIKSNELDELVSTEETNYHYLMLQNIQDGVVDSNLPSLQTIDKKYEKYCINDKNLIISKISPFKVAMAHVNEEQVILANGNLYFIELDEQKVNPIFVQVFLQSEIGMAQLNRFAKGAAMKNISIQDLKMIEIPNIPREKQDLIAEEYENLEDELLVLQRQTDIIRDRKSKLLEEVI